MIASRAWIARNVGFDPIATPAPTSSFRHPEAALPRGGEPEDVQREIIDFDGEGAEGASLFAFSKATGLSRFTDIPWPKGLAPQTDSRPLKGRAGALPRADVLVVTWTVDEGHALSRVLTPGKDSHNDYLSYKHNFRKIAARMSRGSPAVEAGRLGAYWTTRIRGKKVVVFKSDSHLSQDTKKVPKTWQDLPNAQLWQQIVEEVNPSLVITTGTAGGIGTQCEVGDVIVSPVVTFDCQKWLRKEPFHDTSFRDGAPSSVNCARARELFKANADQLPPDNKRAPKIRVARAATAGILTTDFFGFDTSANTYGLQKKGAVSEMGDAVLGLVAKGVGSRFPKWIVVRNVSDPQIKSEGTLKQQAQEAAQIYKAFGRWSTVCSAIVCWALIA